MADKIQAQLLLQAYRESRPDSFWKSFDPTVMGLGAVLDCLFNNEGSASASNIGESIHVSMPRVSALINKLEDHGWVIRQKDPSDARIVLITLTEEGKKKAISNRNCVIAEMERLIDELGFEELMHYCETRKKIYSAINRSKFGSN